MGDYICTFFLGDCTVRLGVKGLEGTRRGDLRSSIVRDGVFFYACFGWGFCFCVSFLIIFECRDLVGDYLALIGEGVLILVAGSLIASTALSSQVSFSSKRSRLCLVTTPTFGLWSGVYDTFFMFCTNPNDEKPSVLFSLSSSYFTSGWTASSLSRILRAFFISARGLGISKSFRITGRGEGPTWDCRFALCVAKY